MTKTVAYHWHLRKVMNEHGMQSTTDLVPLLAEHLSERAEKQVYALLLWTKKEQARLNGVR